MAHSFGDLVRSRRALLGLRQTDISEQCGVCTATVALIEKSGDGHRTPKIETAIRIGKFLKIPVAEIVVSWAIEVVDGDEDLKALKRAQRILSAASAVQGLWT